MTKGYDNIPQLYQVALDLPFYEGGGAAGLVPLAHDIARKESVLDHTMALVGTPTWVQVALSNLTVLQFNSATPDRLTLSAVNSADLAYTTEPFSGLAWVYPHAVGGTIMSKWTNVTSGWIFITLVTGEIQIITETGGPHIDISGSPAGSLVVNTWQLVGFSRLGNSVKIYKNGADITSLVGVHADPAADAGLFYIACDSAIAQSYDGLIWRPRIFNRQLSATEFKELFEMERGLFGV